MTDASRIRIDVTAELSAIHGEIAGEGSHRAQVILVCAELDEALKSMLERLLIPRQKNDQDLLDYQGGLGTFSARVQLAYRLGLIEPDMASDLKTPGRIRNHFAHRGVGASFSENKVKDLVENLKWPIAEGSGRESEPIKHYLNTALVCIVMLKSTAANLTRLSPRETGYLPRPGQARPS